MIPTTDKPSITHNPFLISQKEEHVFNLVENAEGIMQQSKFVIMIM